MELIFMLMSTHIKMRTDFWFIEERGTFFVAVRK